MFNPLKFTSVSGQSIAPTSTEHWSYETTDAPTAIDEANYFLRASSLLKEGNIITVRFIGDNEIYEEVNYVVCYVGGSATETVTETLADGTTLKTTYNGKNVYVVALLDGEDAIIKTIDNATTFTDNLFIPKFKFELGTVALVACGPLGAECKITIKDGGDTVTEVALSQTTNVFSEKQVDLLPTHVFSSNSITIAGNQPANSNVPLKVVFLGKSFYADSHYESRDFNMSVGAFNGGAKTMAFVSPIEGNITKIVAAISGDPGGSGTTLTLSNKGTQIAIQELKFENGASAYDTKTVAPTDIPNAKVTAGDVISVSCSQSSNDITAWCTITITQ